MTTETIASSTESVTARPDAHARADRPSDRTAPLPPVGDDVASPTIIPTDPSTKDPAASARIVDMGSPSPGDAAASARIVDTGTPSPGSAAASARIVDMGAPSLDSAAASARIVDAGAPSLDSAAASARIVDMGAAAAAHIPHRAAVDSAPATTLPLPSNMSALIDALLRERSTFLSRANLTSDPAFVARTLILTTAISAAVFGVAMGLFRPGWQVLSSAVKFPAFLLITAAVATPAITGVRAALGQARQFRKDVFLVLTTMALVGLTLAACAPILLLAVQWGASYHTVVTLTVALCAVAGAGGGTFFLNNLSYDEARASTVLALVTLLVFSSVGCQLAWTLRPFIARPRASFEWLRPLEGSFLDSVTRSAQSAQGRYIRSQAPLPERQRALGDD